MADPVELASHAYEARHGASPRFRTLTALVRAYATTVRTVDAILAPHHLTLSRFELLLALSFSRQGAMPMSRLGRALMVHGSSVTYLVDRLVKAGLVERVADERDRRVSLVRLTDAGRERVEAAADALEEAGFGSLARLGEDDLASFEQLLGELRLGNEDGNGGAASRAQARGR